MYGICFQWLIGVQGVGLGSAVRRMVRWMDQGGLSSQGNSRGMGHFVEHGVFWLLDGPHGLALKKWQWAIDSSTVGS